MSVYIPVWVMVLVGVPLAIVLLIMAVIGFYMTRGFWNNTQ